jgi:HEPN domain-containing protein
MSVEKEKIIKEWLRFAHDDLYAAQHFFDTMEFPIYRIVCFNAQQSAEKYLKAYQIYFDVDIIKTHSLNALIDSLKKYDRDITNLEKSASILSSFAVQYRYPDDFEDLIKTDAELAITVSKQIQKFVLNKIVIN